MKNTDNFHYEGKPSPNQHFSLSAKINGTQWQVHEECTVRSTVCQKACVWLNSEKIKLVALAVSSFACLKASVSQSVVQ